jgi:hypothetical protein
MTGRISAMLAAAVLACAAAAPEDARLLAAKALAAYAANQAQETHWNWTAVETRAMANKAGQVIEEYPSVTAESVIRTGGRRCNAVVAWGDGRKPYLAEADSDARCQAMGVFRPPFEVAALLENAGATLVDRSATAITIAIPPDKPRLKSQDYSTKCAASIRASVKLDPATFFPMSLEGEVVEHGCDTQFQPILQYGARSNGPVKSNFRKGSTFRMRFERQPDKFGNPENSFWIAVDQHYEQPWDSDSVLLYYWGRQMPVSVSGAAHHLIKDVHTTAREFGSESRLISQ